MAAKHDLDYLIYQEPETVLENLYNSCFTQLLSGTYSLQSVAFDTAGNSAHSTGVTIMVNNPSPSTTVGLPASNAVLSGNQWLDATASSGVTSVKYEISGGSLNDAVIATGTLTKFGWLAGWNTTSVPNGTYTLQSVASYSGGVTGVSSGTTITVAN